MVWRHFGWKAGVPASAVGAWVGAGRVQLGKHFLSDVVFGAAVGTMSGRTVTIGHGAKHGRGGAGRRARAAPPSCSRSSSAETAPDTARDADL